MDQPQARATQLLVAALVLLVFNLIVNLVVMQKARAPQQPLPTQSVGFTAPDGTTIEVKREPGQSIEDWKIEARRVYDAFSDTQ